MFIPSIIKSIQRGSIVLGVGTLQASSAAFTAVNVNASEIRYLGSYGGSGSGDFPYIELISTTQVRATRYWANANLTVFFEVIEYYPGFVKSLQRGIINIGLAGVGSTSTLAITSVNTAKASLNLCGLATNDNVSGLLFNWIMSVDLTSSTLITGTADGNSGGTVTSSVEVIEFR